MDKHTRALGLLSFCAITLAPVPASAADVAVTDDHKVEVHGFVSPGFIVTSGNNYLAHSKRGSFEFSEVGLNFTVQLTDKLRTGVQLFSRDLGPTGNYAPRADWYYLDYKFDDWLGIRAGRVKIPFGLYNDTVDIDAGRVQVLLPQSIYSISNRDFLLAQTGVEIYGRVRMGIAGAFEYRLYGGTIFIDVRSQTTLSSEITDLDVPYVVGERLMWETPIDGLRVGGSLQAVKLDGTYTVPPGIPGVIPGPGNIEFPIVLSVASAEYVHDRLQLAAEYGRWRGHLESTHPLPGLDPRAVAVNERAYIMGSYRVTDWFSPGLYYSVIYPDVHNRSGQDKSTHDIGATLRFDINSWWLVKLEGHFMSGTSELNPELNDNHPITQLQQNWGAFLVKSTVHF